MAKKPPIGFDAAMSNIYEAMNGGSSNQPPTFGGMLNTASVGETSGERISRISRDKLVASKNNKTVYDVENLRALALDISRRGIQTPLIVRSRPDGKYVIISGHRRCAANEYAVKEFAYTDGEFVPCIVRDNITNEIDEREALILDNLQRDKTDFNRMMEIMEMSACAAARREAGEDIPNIREYVISRLDVSNSEITRFNKIHSSLSADLLQKFREERFATNVAFSIATNANEDMQAFIYESWDWSQVDENGNPVSLTLPDMQKLMLAYVEQKPVDVAAKTDDADKDREGEKPQKIAFKTVAESVTAIDDALPKIAKYLKSAESLKKGDQKRIARRASKLYAEMQALLSMMDQLGLTSE